MSQSLRDPEIDRLSDGERSVWVAAALQAQLSHIRDNDVGFWCERLRRAQVDDAATLLARLPPPRLDLRESRHARAHRILPDPR